MPHAQPGPTRIFGIPAGDFGLFASMLISGALGFIAFFAFTFVSIFGLMIYNGAGHHQVTLDVSYKYIGLPAGILVLVLSSATLLFIWVRRKMTGR
jgi:hypothetical protein